VTPAWVRSRADRSAQEVSRPKDGQEQWLDTIGGPLETATKGITVNTVTPAFITTGMTPAVPPEVMEKTVARIPAGRLGDPDEVARVVEFLADPESGYITGQVYPVNGGLYR